MGRGRQEEGAFRIILDFCRQPFFPTSIRGSLSRVLRRPIRKRDWYIWRDGKNGGPPQQLDVHLSAVSALEARSPEPGQFYYHYFYAEQPDLELGGIQKCRRQCTTRRDSGTNVAWSGFQPWMRWTRLFEVPDLRGQPGSLEGKNAYGDPITDEKFNKKLPEVHDVMRGLRKVADEHGAVS